MIFSESESFYCSSCSVALFPEYRLVSRNAHRNSIYRNFAALLHKRWFFHKTLDKKRDYRKYASIDSKIHKFQFQQK